MNKFNSLVRFRSRAAAATLLLTTLLLGGCAGMYVGPGTTTGVVGGAAIGAIANGSRGVLPGAVIGDVVGAISDAANGQPGVQPVPQRRYYEDDYYRRPAPVYRVVPAPRRVWDGYCGCWVIVR
jgi:hypothetical protein